jgi:hypothetical protein
MTPPARAAVPVLALALAVLTGTSPRAQDGQPVRRLACGGYDVVPSGFRAGTEATRLNLQKAGRLLTSVTDWRIVSAECADITADGTRELIVRTFSGGAHCCETVRVFALAEPPRLLLRYEANSASGASVEDLDGNGRHELVLGDDSFAYYDELCYACSPSHLPLVACYDGSGFEDCTARFPQLLRSRRDTYLGGVMAVTDAETLDRAKGPALGALAVSELLGEEEEGWAALRKAAASEALMGWLSKALPRVREWAANRARKLEGAKVSGTFLAAESGSRYLETATSCPSGPRGRRWPWASRPRCSTPSPSR